MSKGLKRYIPIWVVLLAAIVIIAETVPFEKDNLFTTVYFFVVIAFVIELFIASLALNNKHKEISQPVFIYSIVGLVMVFIVNWWLIFKQYYHKPWFYIVVNVAVLALHYVFLLLVGSTMSHNVERDEHVKEKTDTMLSLAKEAKILYDNTGNQDIYRLYEALKYSNKASKSHEAEEIIKKEVEALRNVHLPEEVNVKVDHIIALINQRG